MTTPQTTPHTTTDAKHRATKIGTVESDKRSKSRTVVIAYKTPHAKYGKYVSKRSVLQVHDETNESKVGDTVEVTQCRPISRTKRWKLVRVVERSQRVDLVTTQV